MKKVTEQRKTTIIVQEKLTNKKRECHIQFFLSQFCFAKCIEHEFYIKFATKDLTKSYDTTNKKNVES